ncbi:hypothetical protein M501DRAFT_989296 [Patellaria atrata CBS 101060]|uniref:Uncharacterized protein n=1 Tax=Patellaria atrata CBS 101060 TaxID=1346257 RepID=A0A9P4S443_9PEZI|nr:hypothetical protein M501DRAFT_989296 [Patellaria atrata CBS 101060]
MSLQPRPFAVLIGFLPSLNPARDNNISSYIDFTSLVICIESLNTSMTYTNLENLLTTKLARIRAYRSWEIVRNDLRISFELGSYVKIPKNYVEEMIIIFVGIREGATGKEVLDKMILGPHNEQNGERLVRLSCANGHDEEKFDDAGEIFDGVKEMISKMNSARGRRSESNPSDAVETRSETEYSARIDSRSDDIFYDAQETI